MLIVLKKSIILLGILATSIGLSACSNNTTTSSATNSSVHSGHEHHKAAVADIREETPGADVLPQFLKNQSKDMKLVYLSVAKNRELLEKIPCYCGCGMEANHKNSYDCFIFKNKRNGAVVWDDHGTKCGLCIEIAAKAMLDYNRDKSIKDIRKDIDEKYKEGYAQPTPTPSL